MSSKRHAGLMDADIGARCIKTVWGAGYKFEVAE